MYVDYVYDISCVVGDFSVCVQCMMSVKHGVVCVDFTPNPIM